MWVSVLGLILGGCSGDDPDPKPVVESEATADTGVTTTPTADTAPVSTDIQFIDGGFRATSSFLPGSITAQAGQDLLFSWPALTQNARGDAMVPGDVAELVLLEISTASTPETVALLNGRGPSPEDSLEWWTASAKGVGFVSLSAFVARGAPFVPSAYFTTVNDRGWLLLLRNASGDVLQAVTLTPGTGGTAVAIENASSSWSWSTSPGDPVSGLAGDAPNFDWSTGTDLYGEPVDPEVTDLAFVARLPLGTAINVETVLTDAELLYTREVQGDSDADLSFLRASDTTTFAGFDLEGDWVIGLGCQTCTGSAPLVLVPVEVSAR